MLWLRDFIPIEIPTARVMSYGYDSRTAFSKAGIDVDDIAAILNRLAGERRWNVEKT